MILNLDFSFSLDVKDLLHICKRLISWKSHISFSLYVKDLFLSLCKKYIFFFVYTRYVFLFYVQVEYFSLYVQDIFLFACTRHVFLFVCTRHTFFVLDMYFTLYTNSLISFSWYIKTHPSFCIYKSYLIFFDVQDFISFFILVYVRYFFLFVHKRLVSFSLYVRDLSWFFCILHSLSLFILLIYICIKTLHKMYIFPKFDLCKQYPESFRIAKDCLIFHKMKSILTIFLTAPHHHHHHLIQQMAIPD